MNETFTEEEILVPGIDIRIERHRAFLLQLREERKQTGESLNEQLSRYQLEGRVLPDNRNPAGARVAQPSLVDYMDGLRKMYEGVSIQFRHSFLGKRFLHFSGEGKNDLELSIHSDGIYKIVEDDREVYTGDPKGAIRVINKWYQGKEE